jgi:hypothetical protein
LLQNRLWRVSVPWIWHALLHIVLNDLELHDCLNAWSGVGAAVMALLRQAHSPVQITFGVILVVLLYTAAAALHVTVPSVLAVGTFNTVKDLTAITATRMLGNITGIGYDRDTEYVTAELQDIINSIPYLSGQQNSSRLVPGWNGTWVVVPISIRFSNHSIFSTFFSLPDKSLSTSVTLQDSHALDLNIECGVVPRSNSPNETYSTIFSPARKARYAHCIINWN